MQKIEIALACDERYFPGLLTTLSSILVSSTTSCVYRFHILDGGIKDESIGILKRTLSKFRHKTILNIIKIDTSQFIGFPSFFFDSYMTYARIILPSLLQDTDKVIYIDTDILVLKDIAKLWEINLEDNYAAVCIEVVIAKIKNDCLIYNELNVDGDAPYFNAGLMSINLKAFRDKNIEQQTFSYLNNYREYCKYHDQSALNIILYDKLIWLDNVWNIQAHKEVYNPIKDFQLLADFSINFHFVTSFKPWLSFSKQPEYLMFYALLDEIGYKLDQPNFIKSKALYLRKLKLIDFLPIYYTTKGYLCSIRGKQKKAEVLIKVSDYWRDVKKINSHLKKNKQDINSMVCEWRNKIKEKLTA